MPYLTQLVRESLKKVVQEIQAGNRTFGSRKTLGSQLSVSGECVPMDEVAEKYLGEK